MLTLALVLALAPVDPRVETAVAAIAEKDCPRLYGMLSESFQKVAPASTWPRWCASVGRLSELREVGTKDGWQQFKAASTRGPTLFDIAFDARGKIAGLRANADLGASKGKDTAAGLDDALIAIKDRNHVPSLAVLIERPGEAVTVSAVGVRKLGDPTPIGVNDKWHLGSDTKAMTATLAALLVEERKLRWDTTVQELFPEWKDINPAYAKVTLELLLTHRSGLPPNVPNELWKQIYDPKNTKKERTEVAHAALRLPPANEAGVFNYANNGYVVAGVMIERVTHLTWEAALKKRVFDPLEMTSCGFGPPATKGKVDAPWAHRPGADALIPVEPGPDSDNPAGLGPAGTVHCNLVDWAKFATLHLRGERGEATALLSRESMVKLHTPPAGGSYAMGWSVGDAPWAGGKFFAHNGSNTLFMASIYFAPARNLLFLVATNCGDDRAEKAVGEAVSYVVDRYAERAH